MFYRLRRLSELPLLWEQTEVRKWLKWNFPVYQFFHLYCFRHPHWRASRSDDHLPGQQGKAKCAPHSPAPTLLGLMPETVWYVLLAEQWIDMLLDNWGKRPMFFLFIANPCEQDPGKACRAGEGRHDHAWQGGESKSTMSLKWLMQLWLFIIDLICSWQLMMTATKLHRWQLHFSTGLRY